MWLVPRAEGSDVPVPEFARQLFNNHIDSCATCKTELKHLRLTSVVLRKASHKSPRKTVDPLFADRVLARVRREEAGRERVAVHRQALLAGSSCFVAIVVVISSLSGFNPLKAQWITQLSKQSTPVHRALVQSAPPFAEHDPFQPPALSVEPVLDNPVAKSVVDTISLSVSHITTPVHESARIPDDSQTIVSNSTPSGNVPVKQFTAHSTTVTVECTPQLVQSSYKEQDLQTPPAIIQASSGQPPLSIVGTSPSEPAAMPGPMTNAQPIDVGNSVSAPSSSQKDSASDILTVTPVTSQPVH
jgi:hypothetical protein